MDTSPAWEDIFASGGGLDWSLISDNSITTCVDISEISSRILLRQKVEQFFTIVTVHVITKGHVVFSSPSSSIPTVIMTHKSDTTDPSRSIFQSVPILCTYNGCSDVSDDVTSHHFTCRCNVISCDELFMWVWPESVGTMGLICDARLAN